MFHSSTEFLSLQIAEIFSSIGQFSNVLQRQLFNSGEILLKQHHDMFRPDELISVLLKKPPNWGKCPIFSFFVVKALKVSDPICRFVFSKSFYFSSCSCNTTTVSQFLAKVCSTRIVLIFTHLLKKHPIWRSLCFPPPW